MPSVVWRWDCMAIVSDMGSMATMPDQPAEHLGLLPSAVRAVVGQVTSLAMLHEQKDSIFAVSATMPIALGEVD